MLVILMKDQLLQPAAVCQSCPMASQSGLPRWHEGRLRCGRRVESYSVEAHIEEEARKKLEKGAEESAASKCPAQYECAMGFRVAELADTLC